MLRKIAEMEFCHPTCLDKREIGYHKGVLYICRIDNINKQEEVHVFKLLCAHEHFLSFSISLRIPCGTFLWNFYSSIAL